MMVPLMTSVSREPKRSTSRPMNGARAAPRIAPSVVAPAISVRPQPNSSDIGTTKIVRMDMADAALANPMLPDAPATTHP